MAFHFKRTQRLPTACSRLLQQSQTRRRPRVSSSASDKMEGGNEIPFDPWRLLTLEEIKKHSPSLRDGIDWRMEEHCRRKCGEYIKELGAIIKVYTQQQQQQQRQSSSSHRRRQHPQQQQDGDNPPRERSPRFMSTATFLCHKFFLLQSFADNDLKTIVGACVFLACKVNDCPCPHVDIASLTYWLIHRRTDPEAYKHITRNKELLEAWKRIILLAEGLVLNTLRFNLDIAHPQDHLKEYVAELKIESPDRKDALFLVAWSFSNDVHLTTLCLQFSAQQIAGGFIFLGLKFLKLNLQNGSESFWRTQFDVTTPQLEAIINQLIQVYEMYRKPRAAAEGPATNEARERGPNPPSSKGKEVVGSASGAGGRTTVEAAAETLVLLLTGGQAHEPNPSSSRGKEKVEGSASAGGGTPSAGRCSGPAT